MSQVLKRCEVVYALPAEQLIISVEVSADATVADVLEAARIVSSRTDVPWTADSIGIFGERCTREYRPVDGDRIEIYRPLLRDPRRARKEAAEQAKRDARRRSG